MKVGILGSGNVGQALAHGFLSEGHEVWIATREPGGDKAAELGQALKGAVVCDFTTAAREAELVVLCVPWAAAEAAVKLARPEHLRGKVLIETSNMIKQEAGAMVYAGSGVSAAEQVQAWLPASRVVKAFNTVGANMMYRPGFRKMVPTMFLAGNDEAAKQQVSEVVTSFGWEPLDVGTLIAARHLEAMALVWIGYAVSSGDRHHAFKML